MKFHVFPVFKCFCFIGSNQKITCGNHVFLDQFFEAWMTDVSDSIHRDEHSRQVVAIFLRNFNRSGAECLGSVFKCCESKIIVAHIPMQPLAPHVRLRVLEKLFQHALFEIVKICSNVDQLFSALFGDLVDGK